MFVFILLRCVCVCVRVCVCGVYASTYLPTIMCCSHLTVQSFGYLVPSHQPSDVLGVVNDSGTFPEHDRQDLPSTRLTVRLVRGQGWSIGRVVYMTVNHCVCFLRNHVHL